MKSLGVHKNMETPKYVLEYNEEIDAVVSLELLAEYLPKALLITHNWKWVILSLHSALQGFMVLTLQSTNFLNVLTEESARDWLEAYEGNASPSSPPRLDYFMNLYSKIKSDTMKIWNNSKLFQPNSTQDESIRKLNNYRNEFIHFVPIQSILDVRIWARLVIDIVPIIEFLVFESNNVSFNEPSNRQKVKDLCNLINSQAAAILETYDT